MLIFLEINTEDGPAAYNVADIHCVTPAEPRSDGIVRCNLWCGPEWDKTVAIGKSYVAILALLRAAGATLITGTPIPQQPIQPDFGDSSQ